MVSDLDLIRANKIEAEVQFTEKKIRKLIQGQIAHVHIKRPCKIYPLQQKFLYEYEKILDLVAITFEKNRIFEENPIKDWEELVGIYSDLITSIASVIPILHRLKEHNKYTFEHSLNVAIIAGTLGKWLGFKGQELKNIILAGLLHDIGKILIPTEILDKPGKLTDEEMNIMKTHSVHGYDLLSDCDEILPGVKLGILQHHERQDGSGYPQGLQGEDIHMYGSIVAIADICDAMSNKRVYRCKLPSVVVLETISKQMGEKLHPKCCVTFLKNLCKLLPSNDLFGIRPVGQLENG